MRISIVCILNETNVCKQLRSLSSSARRARRPKCHKRDRHTSCLSSSHTAAFRAFSQGWRITSCCSHPYHLSQETLLQHTTIYTRNKTENQNWQRRTLHGRVITAMQQQNAASRPLALAATATASLPRVLHAIDFVASARPLHIRSDQTRTRVRLCQQPK
jgi:hypothetical protein